MIIVLALYTCLVGAWLWSEFKNKSLNTRTCLGFLAIAIPVATIYAVEQARIARAAHTSAAFRMLGETLDSGDVTLAKQAIDEYARTEGSPSAVMEYISRNQKE